MSMAKTTSKRCVSQLLLTNTTSAVSHLGLYLFPRQEILAFLLHLSAPGSLLLGTLVLRS